MDKLKIFVVCHKPGPVHKDDIYTPIHVGKAISKYRVEMEDMIGDDTEDNISEKNPEYCELTAQYWAWKNFNDVEYIGFCHYRRFFDLRINAENVDEIFKDKDVILLNATQVGKIENFLYSMVLREDVTLFLMALKRLYPEYEKTTLDYLLGNRFYSNSMLICRKKLFDDYAKWMFSILAECEKYMRPSGYTRGRRALAYLGEFFMPVYMLHNQLRIKTIGVTPMYGEKGKKASLLGCAFMKVHQHCISFFSKKPRNFEEYYYDSVMVGLKADGIIDEMIENEK